MIWTILFICVLHRTHAGYKETSITCECTTRHCLEHHMEHCNTTGVCFSQYLDRHDGSHPLVRGCIQSKTPLLCENRRPAVARGAWPLLLCCNSNLCNRDVVPTPPPWFEMRNKENSSLILPEESLPDTNEDNQNQVFKNSIDVDVLPFNQQSTSSETPPTIILAPKSKTKSSSIPHIISPIYISVLVLGVISLVIIGIIATVVLKRSNRFYMEQYGALEHQYEQCCPKHASEHFASSVHVHCDCDSHVDSLSTCSQPYVHAIYQNQDSNNT